MTRLFALTIAALTGVAVKTLRDAIHTRRPESEPYLYTVKWLYGDDLGPEYEGVFRTVEAALEQGDLDQQFTRRDTGLQFCVADYHTRAELCYPIYPKPKQFDPESGSSFMD